MGFVLSSLTLKKIEELKKVLGIGQTEETRARQREDEIGTRPGYVKITQVNAHGKEYFCIDAQEEIIFMENHPGAKTETFKIELPASVADKYLNDPENKKHFTRKDK